MTLVACPCIVPCPFSQASRVFEEQDEFDRMFLEYQENVCNGTVNTFRANLTVRENAFLGVPGGWQVRLRVLRCRVACYRCMGGTAAVRSSRDAVPCSASPTKWGRSQADGRCVLDSHGSAV